MASNIYFQNALADQNLLNEINREVIQQAGIDVMYLPRTLVKEDLVMNEAVSYTHLTLPTILLV